MYYNNTLSKQQNAFLVACSITSSPLPPEPVPIVPQLLVPRGLLDAMGGLLDEYVRCCQTLSKLMSVLSPVYSDVEFVFPRRGKPPQAAKIPKMR